MNVLMPNDLKWSPVCTGLERAVLHNVSLLRQDINSYEVRDFVEMEQPQGMDLATFIDYINEIA